MGSAALCSVRQPASPIGSSRIRSHFAIISLAGLNALPRDIAAKAKNKGSSLRFCHARESGHSVLVAGGDKARRMGYWIARAFARRSNARPSRQKALARVGGQEQRKKMTDWFV